MLIYILSYMFVIIMGLFYLRNDDADRRKVFCLVTGLLYFVISSIRGFHVGYDTYNYYYEFIKIKDYSLEQVLATVSANKNEFIPHVLMWIVSVVTGNFTVFLTIVAGLFTATTWRYIYKYSLDPCLSIVFLLAFNLFQFSLTGLRQTLAISFILIALERLKDNKPIKAILFIVVATFCHTSALIFCVVLVLRRVKVSRQVLLGSAVFLIVVFLLRVQIARWIMPLITKRGYDVSINNSGYTMALVIFLLYVLFAVFSREYGARCDDYRLVAWLMFLACFFEMLVPVQNIFFRVAFYFLIIGIELIPNMSIYIHNKKSRLLIRVLLYVFLSIQYLFFTIDSSGIVPYVAFWQ